MLSVMDDKITIRNRIQNGIENLDSDQLKRVQSFLADLTAEKIEQEAEKLTNEGLYTADAITAAIYKVRSKKTN